MAKAIEARNIGQEIVDLLMASGPLGGQAIMAELAKGGAVAQKDVLDAAKVLIDGEFIVQDGKVFDMHSKYKADVEETVEEEDPFGPDETVVAQPVAKVASKPTAKAQPVAAAKATATKPVAQKKAAPAPKAQPEDDGSFKMGYKTMDKLTADELTERVEVGLRMAEGLFATNDYESQIAAELIMRWIPRANRRLKGAAKA